MSVFFVRYQWETIGYIDVPYHAPSQTASEFANFFGNFQTSTYEKQGHATITCLVTEFRGYRHVKSCMPPTK